MKLLISLIAVITFLGCNVPNKKFMLFPRVSFKGTGVSYFTNQELKILFKKHSENFDKKPRLMVIDTLAISWDSTNVEEVYKEREEGDTSNPSLYVETKYALDPTKTVFLYHTSKKNLYYAYTILKLPKNLYVSYELTNKFPEEASKFYDSVKIEKRTLDSIKQRFLNRKLRRININD